MALPKLTIPEFTTTVPSTQQEVVYRPFTVKEQKSLLFAVESGEMDDIIRVTEDILKECIISDIDTSQLATFDIEYLFLQIRGKSVGEILKFRLRHATSNECKHVTDFELSVDNVNVDVPADWSNKIDIGNGIGIVMKKPSFKNMRSLIEVEDDSIKMIQFVCDNIEMAYDENQVYDTFTPQEAEEFVMSFSQAQFTQIVNYYRDTPVLQHKITYLCSECNKEESVTLNGLKDFF